jgi:oligo-1,6-glucosidase
MTNFPFTSPDQFQDVEAVNHWKDVVASGADQAAALAAMRAVSRDNARTPMQWDGSPSAGFTEGTPWLAVNPNHTWLNAAAQVGDESSVFAHYRDLIRLRHEHAIFADGDFAGVLENDPDLWAYTRSTETQRMLVVANCGRTPRAIELGDGWTGARLLLGNLPGTEPELRTGGLELAPWDARIYLLG